MTTRTDRQIRHNLNTLFLSLGLKSKGESYVQGLIRSLAHSRDMVASNEFPISIKTCGLSPTLKECFVAVLDRLTLRYLVSLRLCFNP